MVSCPPDTDQVCCAAAANRASRSIVIIDHYEIKHLFLSGLATSKIILKEEVLKNGLFVLCDIGADLSEITIFKDAVLQHVETLPLGGNDLTQELARVLKIPFELAEEIKRSYAYIIDPAAIKDDKEVIIKKADYYKVISQRKICEVITAKTKSICQSIKEKVQGQLPPDKVTVDKIFVSGRAVLIDGFLEMIEETLAVPTKLAAGKEFSFDWRKKAEITSSPAKLLNYATALGLLTEAMELEKKNKIFSTLHSKNLILRIVNHARDLFQEYF